MPSARFAGHGARSHAPGMFVVTEAEAAAIRTAFEQSGGLVAVVELRRLFPLITDTHAGGRVRSDHRRLEAAGHAAAPGQASG